MLFIRQKTYLKLFTCLRNEGNKVNLFNLFINPFYDLLPNWLILLLKHLHLLDPFIWEYNLRFSSVILRANQRELLFVRFALLLEYRWKRKMPKDWMIVNRCEEWDCYVLTFANCYICFLQINNWMAESTNSALDDIVIPSALSCRSINKVFLRLNFLNFYLLNNWGSDLPLLLLWLCLLYVTLYTLNKLLILPLPLDNPDSILKLFLFLENLHDARFLDTHLTLAGRWVFITICHFKCFL